MLVHGQETAPDLAAVIAVAEQFAAAHGGTARFQVCPACPPSLDEALALRGYVWGGDVHLVAARRGRRPAPGETGVHVDLSERLDSAWMQVLLAAQAGDVDAGAEERLLSRVDLSSAYATALLAGQPVAVGRAVLDRGWTGVFSMATMPDARRRGAGRAALAALAGWARSRDCDHCTCG